MVMERIEAGHQPEQLTLQGVADEVDELKMMLANALDQLREIKGLLAEFRQDFRDHMDG